MAVFVGRLNKLLQTYRSESIKATAYITAERRLGANNLDHIEYMSLVTFSSISGSTVQSVSVDVRVVSLPLAIDDLFVVVCVVEVDQYRLSYDRRVPLIGTLAVVAVEAEY
jgi:hypothetical protein